MEENKLRGDIILIAPLLLGKLCIYSSLLSLPNQYTTIMSTPVFYFSRLYAFVIFNKIVWLSFDHHVTFLFIVHFHFLWCSQGGSKFLRIIESRNHRIMEKFGLEGALKINPACHGPGHLPLDQVDQSSIHPGLEDFQGGGIHKFSFFSLLEIVWYW